MKKSLSGLFSVFLVLAMSNAALAQPPRGGWGGGGGGGRGGSNLAQEVDRLVNRAEQKLQAADSSLRAAERSLRADFEREYQAAMAMVCQGHCSPGITQALQRIHATVDQAVGEIQAAARAVDGVGSDLDDISDEVRDSADSCRDDFGGRR